MLPKFYNTILVHLGAKVINISRGKDYSVFKKRELEKVRKECDRTVKLEDGSTMLVPYCSKCDNPVGKDGLFLDIDRGQPSMVCSLCYYPMNLDRITFKDSGHLIYAPDLTQAQVNAIALMIYYLRELPDVSADILELTADVEDLVFRRSDTLVNLLCQGANVPSIVCQFLFMLPDHEFAKVGGMFESVRLFPSEKLARESLNYLSTNVLRGYKPHVWISMLQKIKELENKKG